MLHPRQAAEAGGQLPQLVVAQQQAGQPREAAQVGGQRGQLVALGEWVGGNGASHSAGCTGSGW
mgnify:CR=1 FL=1